MHSSLKALLCLAVIIAIILCSHDGHYIFAAILAMPLYKLVLSLLKFFGRCISFVYRRYFELNPIWDKWKVPKFKPFFKIKGGQ